MVAAAYTLFSDRGYEGTSMVEIAAEAGVAVQTLYFTFETKSRLLQEAFFQAVLGDSPTPPHEQPWFDRMLRARYIGAAISHMVDGSTDIFAKVAPLVASVRAVAADPEVAQIWAQQEEMRRRGYSDVVRTLSSKRPLHQGLTEQKATDILLVVLSPDVYRAYVVDCGWSKSEYRAWATDTLYYQLFRDVLGVVE